MQATEVVDLLAANLLACCKSHILFAMNIREKFLKSVGEDYPQAFLRFIEQHVSLANCLICSSYRDFDLYIMCYVAEFVNNQEQLLVN